MKHTIGALIASATIALASAAHADAPVQLRSRIEADGPAVTLGDVFEGAGQAATRPIAPAPGPGQVSSLSVEFLVAAAHSAGLSFTPPQGVADVQIIHPAGMRATVAPASVAEGGAAASSAARGSAGVRRGETVMVVYEVPGLSISSRVRAEENGAIGQRIRFSNPQSGQTVEAVVTGPGAARASPRTP